VRLISSHIRRQLLRSSIARIWAIELRKDSSARCSRHSQNPSRHQAHPHLRSGAMSRRSARGSVTTLQACSPRVGITTSTIRFHPPKSWSFSDKYYGPWNRAFSSLDDLATKKLREELETLWSTHNRAGGELTFVAAEYFQVTAVRAQIG
jgi:hypothetical protein